MLKFERYVELVAFPRRAYLSAGTSRITDLAAFMALRFGDDNIAKYHSAVASVVGAQHVFSYGRGRMGLYEVLRALELDPGDEVIVPGYTCIVMPVAIMCAGARPVYADVDERTFNLDARAAEAAITPRTRAILAQHTFGIPCDLDALQGIADRYGLYLIEDAAHALGARCHDQPCGSFGVATVFSTESSKMISTVRGGLVTTNREDIAQRLRLSYQAIPFDSEEITRNAIAKWALAAVERHPRLGPHLTRFDHRLLRKWRPAHDALNGIDASGAEEYQAALEGDVVPPFPSRIRPELALIGLLQLRRLEQDVVHRNFLARHLWEKAEEFGWAVPIIEWNTTRPSFVRFPFLVENREAWIRLLHRARVEAGEWLNHPLHPAGSAYEKCGYKMGMCPVAERIASRIINIPVHSRTGEWMVTSIEKQFRRTPGLYVTRGSTALS